MPGNLGTWSPALVSWSIGPGWIGWMPYGAMLPAGYNGVVTVPGSTVQNGTPIDPAGVVRRPPGEGVPIARPSFQPSTLAMLSGVPLPNGIKLHGSAVDPPAAVRPHSGAVTVAGAESRSQPGSAGITAARASHGYAPSPVQSRSAPATVVMNGDPALERSAFPNGSGFWSHFLGTGSTQPLHVRVGTTLGGHFPVGEAGGAHSAEGLYGVHEFTGNPAVNGSRESAFSRTSGGAFVLPHGGASGLARGSEGGSLAASSGFSGGSTGPSSGLSSSSGTIGHATGGVSSGASGGGGGHH
jgi:hypothetical protein